MGLKLTECMSHLNGEVCNLYPRARAKNRYLRRELEKDRWKGRQGENLLNFLNLLNAELFNPCCMPYIFAVELYWSQI